MLFSKERLSGVLVAIVSIGCLNSILWFAELLVIRIQMRTRDLQSHVLVDVPDKVNDTSLTNRVSNR